MVAICKAKESALSQDKLKARFNYDPETGIFTRLIKPGRGGVIGQAVGNKYKATGYLRFNIDNNNYLAHRVAWLYMTGEWPKSDVDHINHIKDDNRWINLRSVTRSENRKNSYLTTLNTSGVSGVSYKAKPQKWAATINSNRKCIFLGEFKGKFEACCARKSAELKYGFHENHGKPRGYKQ